MRNFLPHIRVSTPAKDGMRRRRTNREPDTRFTMAANRQPHLRTQLGAGVVVLVLLATGVWSSAGAGRSRPVRVAAVGGAGPPRRVAVR